MGLSVSSRFPTFNCHRFFSVHILSVSSPSQLFIYTFSSIFSGPRPFFSSPWWPIQTLLWCLCSAMRCKLFYIYYISFINFFITIIYIILLIHLIKFLTLFAFIINLYPWAFVRSFFISLFTLAWSLLNLPACQMMPRCDVFTLNFLLEGGDDLFSFLDKNWMDI